jgi:hypothetical protein
MLLVAVMGSFLAVTRSWGKDEWLSAGMLAALTAAYWALDYREEMIQ